MHVPHGDPVLVEEGTGDPLPDGLVPLSLIRLPVMKSMISSSASESGAPASVPTSSSPAPMSKLTCSIRHDPASAPVGATACPGGTLYLTGSFRTGILGSYGAGRGGPPGYGALNSPGSGMPTVPSVSGRLWIIVRSRSGDAGAGACSNSAFAPFAAHPSAEVPVGGGTSTNGTDLPLPLVGSRRVRW